jgi:hypothetical protein
MRRLLTTLILSLLIAGCDAVEDLKEMGQKQSIVQQAIKDSHGWDVQVGWHMSNGILTQVTVVLDADEIRDTKVAEIEKAAIDAISRAFKSKPQRVFLQISTDIDEVATTPSLEQKKL